MTWHHVALAVLGVATGLGGNLIPGAHDFATAAAWALIGGALGNAMGPAITRLIGFAARPAPTEAKASSDSPNS